MPIYWMSFCDPHKNPGTQFKGVIISEAEDFLSAVRKTTHLGINPHGEIRSFEVENVNNAFDGHFDKLLSKEDLKKYDLI